MKLKSFFSVFTFGYILIFGFSYIIIPFFFIKDYDRTYLNQLIFLMSFSVLFYIIGLNIGQAKKKSRMYSVDFNKVINWFFILFLVIVFVIIITARNIPLISFFKGASSADLTIFREDFLKARAGWEASLNYIISIINSSFLPYLICASFIIKHKKRFLYAGVFLLYSISFLEKAYFFKLALPLFFLYFFTVKNKFRFVIKGVILIFGILVLMFIITGTKESIFVRNYESFFSIYYNANGPIEGMFWRAFVVPVATAVDGLKVFTTMFNGELLNGSTSSLISLITNQPRVNFERYLYQEQFGGVETGNANQVYVIEAFINFGLVGVILFSFIVGRIVRFCILKRDIVLIAILPLFLYSLFNSGLIGNLFSNGFILFFILINKFKLKYDTRESYSGNRS